MGEACARGLGRAGRRGCRGTRRRRFHWPGDDSRGSLWPLPRPARTRSLRERHSKIWARAGRRRGSGSSRTRAATSTTLTSTACSSSARRTGWIPRPIRSGGVPGAGGRGAHRVEPRAAKLRPRTAYDAQFSLPYSVACAPPRWPGRSRHLRAGASGRPGPPGTREPGDPYRRSRLALPARFSRLGARASQDDRDARGARARRTGRCRPALPPEAIVGSSAPTPRERPPRAWRRLERSGSAVGPALGCSRGHARYVVVEVSKSTWPTCCESSTMGACG